VICLAAGNYGTWSGTGKAITIREESGAAATMGVNFGSGDAGFTIDGLTIPGGQIGSTGCTGCPGWGSEGGG